MSVTASSNGKFYTGRPLIEGNASGRLLGSNVALSFWGGIDPQSGVVIDRHHPLHGQCIKNCVLAIPSGRGSSTGSAILLELMLSGNAPRGLIFMRREDILILGVIVAQEIFGIPPIPVVVLDSEDFCGVLNAQYVHLDGNLVSETNPLRKRSESFPDLPADRRESKENVLRVNEKDESFLNGFYGDAARSAMRIITRMASLQGAHELIEVSQVHIDGCIYTGAGSLAFAERLRDMGGKVLVPTTLNSISIDQQYWRAQGIESAFGEAAQKLAAAYTDMGARSTFTCAPYMLDSAPKLGDQIAWAESNAVVYANSVLGARSQKYPDFLDAAIALTGRAPSTGLHLENNRHANVIVRVLNLNTQHTDDSFYPLLGYCIGGVAGNRIPLIIGLETFNPSTDDLKAFSAAFGTSASAAMFHMLGVTPEAETEAKTSEKNSCDFQEIETIQLGLEDIEKCRIDLNTAKEDEAVDLVSFGSPHFSLSEIRKLCKICKGRIKKDNISVVITCGRSTYSLAVQAGYVEQLIGFGVQFVQDTCWCMISDPLIPPAAKVIMTNSAKYAHYGPGITGRRFRFGSIAACIEAATS